MKSPVNSVSTNLATSEKHSSHNWIRSFDANPSPDEHQLPRVGKPSPTLGPFRESKWTPFRREGHPFPAEPTTVRSTAVCEGSAGACSPRTAARESLPQGPMTRPPLTLLRSILAHSVKRSDRSAGCPRVSVNPHCMIAKLKLKEKGPISGNSD